MNIARFNEDIDRTVRGVCDIRPEWIKMQIQHIRNFSSEPSELAILKEKECFSNDWTNREGRRIWELINFKNSN